MSGSPPASAHGLGRTVSKRGYSRGVGYPVRPQEPHVRSPEEKLNAAIFQGRPGEPTSTDMSEGLMDAKVAAAEARTDAKFEALRGDLKAIAASTSGIKTTVVGTGIAVVAIVIAVLAYGGDRFGAGMDISGIIDAAAKRAVQQALPSQPLGTIDATPATPN